MPELTNQNRGLRFESWITPFFFVGEEGKRGREEKRRRGEEEKRGRGKKNGDLGLTDVVPAK